MSNWQKQILSLRHKQQFMYIMVFSLATVLVWVSVSLFTSQKKTEIPAELQVLAKPLTPTINRAVLTELQAKRAYSESELQAFPIYKIQSDQRGDTQKVTIDTPDPESPSSVRSVVPTPEPTPQPAVDAPLADPSTSPTEPADNGVTDPAPTATESAQADTP